MTTLAITLALALAVAWITAAATAVRTVSRIWLRHWVEQQLAGGDVAEISLDRPKRWLLAGGTAIAAIVFAMGATIGLRARGAAAVEQVAVALLVLMVAGQLLPRAIARRWAAPLVPVLIPVLRVLSFICTPFFAFAGLFAQQRADAADPAHEERDALEDLLREGELEGVGEASESAIISGVMDFGDKLAFEVMTPRDQIIAVERSMPAAEIARAVAQSKYSRVPVYEKDLDHVVGLLHSFDVFAYPHAPAASLRRVVVVQAATPCHELMRRMLRDHVHLAIVQGVVGDTVGLVTLEDLVEELVGEISDEHDEPQAVTA